MSKASPFLYQLMHTQKRARARKMSIVGVLWLGAFLGVVALIADMYVRESASPMGPSMTGPLFFGVVLGLPTFLGLLYAIASVYELRGGGPDLAFLEESWDQILSVEKLTTHYKTSGGVALGDTDDVVVVLKDGSKTMLAVRRADVDLVVQTIASEVLRARG